VAGPIEQFEIKPLFSLGEVTGYQIVFTSSAAYMIAAASLGVFSCLPPRCAGSLCRRARSRRRIDPRIHRQDAARQYGGGRHAVLPAGILAVHVHPDGKPPGDVPLCRHGHQPDRGDIGAGDACFPHRHAILVQARAPLLPPVPAEGVPLVLSPIIVPIEIVCYLSRPISHSVRLFAVMLAGHITL